MNYAWHRNALLKAVRFKTFDELIKENDPTEHPQDQSLFGKKTQEGDIKIDKNGKQKIFRNGRWRSLDDGTKKLVEANKNKVTADVEWRQKEKQQAAKWKRNTLRSHPKLFEFSRKTVTFGEAPRLKPQEGDTKPGANGNILTLKNHRWRLSEGDEYDRYEPLPKYGTNTEKMSLDEYKKYSKEYANTIYDSGVTIDDWHLHTFAEFDPISEDDFLDVEAPIFTSNSGSQYKVKNGYVYRAANHWGYLASVTWELKGDKDYYAPRNRNVKLSDKVKYGKAKLSDFRRLRTGGYQKINEARENKEGDKYAPVNDGNN